MSPEASCALPPAPSRLSHLLFEAQETLLSVTPCRLRGRICFMTGGEGQGKSCVPGKWFVKEGWLFCGLLFFSVLN